MTHARSVLTGVLALCLLHCDLYYAEQVEEVSFSEDVAPILKRNCLICHMPGDKQGNLSLYPDAIVSLREVSSTQSPLFLVKPGSAEQSYLYHKIAGTQEDVGGFGARMPFQKKPLHEDKIETVRQWVEQGAKNN